jgi:hypothetical protein
MSTINLNPDGSYNYYSDPFTWDPTDDTFSLFQSTLSPSERDEELNQSQPFQTPESSPRRSPPSENVSLPSAALSPVPLSNTTEQQFQQEVVPNSLVEPRGGQLLQKMRLSRGWTPKELCEQVDRIKLVGYEVTSIMEWESKDEISWRASTIFGSLFGKDPHLFYNRKENPTEVQGLKRQRSWETASAPGEIDSYLLHRDATLAQDLSELPVDAPSGPPQVIGLRGGPLLKAILLYYDWTEEDLQRQIKRTRNKNYKVSSIRTWKVDQISRPAAEVLGSLFGLNADLFDRYSEKTCQSWIPPSFQQGSSLPSSEQKKRTIERISNVASQHLQEDAPPSQTPESSFIELPHFGSLEEAEPDPFAFSPGNDLSTGFDLFCSYSKQTGQSWTAPPLQKQESPTLNIARKPFEQGLPDELIGLRGGSLLRAIRIYLGWTLEGLKWQIEQTEHRNFAVSSIRTWESGGIISVPGAITLGSLFGIDSGLFNPKAGTS